MLKNKEDGRREDTFVATIIMYNIRACWHVLNFLKISNCVLFNSLRIVSQAFLFSKWDCKEY